MIAAENTNAGLSLKGQSGHHLYFYSECVRIGYYLVAIIISLVTQYIHPFFINSKIWIPVYFVIFFALVFHLLSLAYSQNKKNKFEKLSFFIDTIFLAIVIFLTYSSYPIFTFLFLINIGLYSILYGKDSSLILAGFTTLAYAICFSKGSPNFSGLDALPLYFNMATFYAVAILSGYIGELYIDKTEQLQKTQKDLSELQSFSDVVVENIGTGLITLDKGLNVAYFNQAAQSIFEESLSLKNVPDFLSPKIKSHRSEIKSTFREEIEIRVAGKIKFLETISSYLPTTENQEASWILLLQDLTEVKNLEKELALKEKLAAVGQLAGGIAHEIRNPLASISGSVEMLQQTVEGLSPENNKLFSIIIKEIDRLNNLITEFLSFVRPEVIKGDKCSIDGMAEDIFTLMKFNQELIDQTQLVTDFESCEILCDKGKLKQALLNIIVNALQAVKGSEDGKVKCTGKVEGRFYIIEIADNGPGIPKSIVSKVFEPFYTTKAKGTGLGLAITHRIIEGHMGEIKVSSEEKKGTTFLIKLPIE